MNTHVEEVDVLLEKKAGRGIWEEYADGSEGDTEWLAMSAQSRRRDDDDKRDDDDRKMSVVDKKEGMSLDFYLISQRTLKSNDLLFIFLTNFPFRKKNILLDAL